MIRSISTVCKRGGAFALFTLLLASAIAITLASGIANATTFTVTNTTDSGPGSLRQAITDANTTAGADTINFNIPASTDPGCNATNGVCRISPATGLPSITEAVTIDGYSQSGASPNTLATGNNARLKIVLRGKYDDFNQSGLTITGSNSVVKGLIINRWSSNGVFVDNFDNTTGASGNRIKGNFIGTDYKGTIDRGNRFNGVFILQAANNVVGGTSPSARNLISGNDGAGVFVSNSGASGNRIKGNFIGTDASGSQPLGNSSDGVAISEAANNVVGGTSPSARNLISRNGLTGVSVGGSVGATGNRILGNSIFNNDGRGINLLSEREDANGATPNDEGDADVGPNNLQNKPVITSATTSSGQTSIRGTLNSTPSATFTIEFFSSFDPDPSGADPEGETFIGSKLVSTDASGNATFRFSPTTAVAVGRQITATATRNATGDTSEFSFQRQVTAS
jgi:hypothetical protein